MALAAQLSELPHDDIVKQVAARYCARVPWASKDDLEQVGRVTILEALPNWEPAMGVPLGAYLHRAVVLAMRRQLWADSSPVSGGWHRPEQTRTQTRAALLEDAHHDENPSPEARTDEARWRHAVRSRLEAIAPCPESADAALEVCTVSEAARSMGVSQTWVRQLVARLRNRAQSDIVLFELIADRR